MKRCLTLLGILLLATTLLGCGAKTISTAAVVSHEFSKALLTAQQITTDTYKADPTVMSQETYFALQKRYEDLARVGLAINAALRDGDKKSAVAQVSAGLDVLDALVANDLPKLKANERLIVMISVAAVRTVLLSYASSLGGGA